MFVESNRIERSVCCKREETVFLPAGFVVPYGDDTYPYTIFAESSWYRGSSIGPPGDGVIRKSDSSS